MLVAAGVDVTIKFCRWVSQTYPHTQFFLRKQFILFHKIYYITMSVIKPTAKQQGDCINIRWFLHFGVYFTEPTDQWTKAHRGAKADKEELLKYPQQWRIWNIFWQVSKFAHMEEEDRKEIPVMNRFRFGFFNQWLIVQLPCLTKIPNLWPLNVIM